MITGLLAHINFLDGFSFVVVHNGNGGLALVVDQKIP